MEERSFFASSRFLLVLTLFLLFGLALSIRLYDLTDLPLDFHPTRQLFSAIKARGMYFQTRWDLPDWQRTMAIQQWKLKVTVEPEIMERLAAFAYRYTGEQLWVPRLFSVVFWLTGGIFLYLLARDLASTDGAILALAFYLFAPYGIHASRSFQPDPLMVMLILAFWWLVSRWAASLPTVKKARGWGLALIAGLAGGLAIYIKLVAAFFVIGGALGAALSRIKLQTLLRYPQTWGMAALGVLPGALWALSSGLASGYIEQDVNSRFIPSLLASPLFYLQWQNKAAAVSGSLGIALGLLGLFFFPGRKARGTLAGMWISYLLFGLYFNYHISTHDYYSLPLLPIVSLSLSGLGTWFFSALAQFAHGTGNAIAPGEETSRGVNWRRAFLLVIMAYGMFSVVWTVRNDMKSTDYRPRQDWWEEISAALGRDASLAALTEDYGLQLSYWGWQNAAVWPSSGDIYLSQVRGSQRNFQAFFDRIAGKKAFFLVTDMDDFNRQPELQALLAGYPLHAGGDGYLIYDLLHPVEAQP